MFLFDSAFVTQLAVSNDPLPWEIIPNDLNLPFSSSEIKTRKTGGGL